MTGIISANHKGLCWKLGNILLLINKAHTSSLTKHIHQSVIDYRLVIKH